MRIFRSPKEQEELERRREQRFQSARATVGAGYMNDTKWYEVFQILAKHVNADLHFRMKVLGDCPAVEDKRYWSVSRQWTDSPSGPFENREIEWLEILGSDARLVREEVGRIGKLQISERPDGFCIMGYAK